MYYIIDLNTTEKAETLEAAQEIAEEWRDGQRDIIADMSDDELRYARKSPLSPCGLDNGDIEIWNSDTDRWQDGERVEVYRGRDLIAEDYANRGLHRYTVLFGYHAFPIEEWNKGEFDDIDDAIGFCKNYPAITNIENDGYIYVADNDNDMEVVDGTYLELRRKTEN